VLEALSTPYGTGLLLGGFGRGSDEKDGNRVKAECQALIPLGPQALSLSPGITIISTILIHSITFSAH